MAEEQRTAVINLETRLVDNVAVVKDGDGSTAPAGFLFVRSDEATIGDSWDGAQIIKAPQPIAEIREQETLSLAMVGGAADRPTLSGDLDALAARVAAIEAKLGL